MTTDTDSLKAALEPFAKEATLHDGWDNEKRVEVSLGHLRAAYYALRASTDAAPVADDRSFQEMEDEAYAMAEAEAYAQPPAAEPVDTRPVCSEDGCHRREDCGPFCRNKN